MKMDSDSKIFTDLALAMGVEAFDFQQKFEQQKSAEISALPTPRNDEQRLA
jgi:hypothetical protein